MDLKNYPSAVDALPGVKVGSDISGIYEMLRSGKQLTALDAVFSNHTVCLGKYISILKNKYKIPIKSEWVKVGEKGKRVKRYSL